MNFAFFSQIAFINPWILAAGLSLPVLWYLLRVTPPAPKKIFFPAVRFLKGLVAERTTPDKTPWWLLVLRCLILAFVIIALAKPVFNPASELPGRSDIRIVMDTGWEAAQNWRDQLRAAEDIVSVAARENRNIYLITTTTQSGQSVPFSAGPMGASEAKSILRGLKPNSWPADYPAVSGVINTQNIPQSIMSFWMGSGLRGDGFNALIGALQSQGGVTYYAPSAESMPVAISSTPSDIAEGGIRALIAFSDQNSPARPFTFHALNTNNGIVNFERMDIAPKTGAITIPTADALADTIAKIKLIGIQGSGGTLLLDDQFKKRSVGIVSAGPDDDAKPLIDSIYYLKRALEPYSVLNLAPLDDLITANPSVIIMPDIGALPPSILNDLENWVKDGGLLLRFAGDAMSAADNFLTPVDLRKGTRALEGDITWAQPQAIAPFPDTSPLYDISLNDDIMVRQQILAQPSGDLDDKTWARLHDGTPIITASALDRGLLVLVHTTASPAWSDLALSGAYVKILRKIITLSNASISQDINRQSLQPIAVMDGFGELVEPQNVTPIIAKDFATIKPSAQNPPGLYGQAGNVKVLNLGDRIGDLKSVKTLPGSVKQLTYNQNYEQNLMPFFLTLALILLLIDWIIMIALSGNFKRPTLKSFRHLKPLIVFTFILSLPYNAKAQDDVTLAGDLYMGFIKSGDQGVDDIAQRGLDALAGVLTQRTSVEPKGTIALNPESDELSFFAFLYWPVASAPRTLSDQALSNIQNYLDNGGTILFDTRDQNYAVQNNVNFAASENARALRATIAGLNIPALTIAPNDHVLHKSFYLLDDFPGRYSGGQLWVEGRSANGRDGVSSVMIGGNDWASAWAAEQSGGTMRPYLNGGPRQQEMSFRFGVNMMMYALTGNYKADQVHLPHILERLDQ